MTKREYVSMRGKKVDLELLKKVNELVPAVGNVKVNARGDELGPGGKIVKTREDIIKDYYKSSPNQVIQETSKKEKSVKEDSVKDNIVTAPTTVSETIAITELTELEKELIDQEDWAEDSSGNFVKKDKATKKTKTE